MKPEPQPISSSALSHSLADLYRRLQPEPEPRSEQTLCDLFAAEVERSRSATALVTVDDRLDYDALSAAAGRVAAALVGLGVGPEVRVAVYLRRRAGLIAALLGIQRAGGAYVPLDPAWPSERSATLLEDCAPRVVITEKELRAALPAATARVVEIEDLLAADIEPWPAAEHRALPDALAYLIYTSGSTGKPKGVAISHRNAVNLILWGARYFSRQDLDGMLLATSINFDLSVFEIFLPLAIGGKIILADNALALPSHPAREEVTFINTVPSAIAELVRQGDLPASVRVIGLAGEALRRELVQRILACRADLRVVNLYAPSETTTFSTVSEAHLAAGEPTIGIGLDNTRAFVLDPAGALLPVGEIGELYLGGHGITRGYLGRAQLTAAAFVPDPFSQMPGWRPGDRLYRTGDLARLRPDGEFDFLGRRDHQVKIRGFRIELGEIERTLEQEKTLERAAVLARSNELGELELVAWLEPRQEIPPFELIAATRAALSRKLPSYMVPTRYEVLPQLPLLPNGKIDRKTLAIRALPPRSEELPAGDAPRGATEVALAALFCEVLGLTEISRDDNFLALGGHSLLASRLAARWQGEHGVRLELKDFFESHSLAELAAVADRLAAVQPNAPAAGPRPRPERAAEPRTLTAAQERLYFLYRLEPGSAFYNESISLHLEGQLDVEALRRALTRVVERHDVLRAVFQEVAGIPQQLLRATGDFGLVVEKLAPADFPAREQELLAQPYDLTESAFRAHLLLSGEGEQVLFLGGHHIVFDGISFDILEKELAIAYSAYLAGDEPKLPRLAFGFADFAEWQRSRIGQEQEQKQIDYWRRRLAGNESLELPLDAPRPPRQSFRGAVRRFHLPAAVVQKLEKFGREHGSSPFLTFLAPFLSLLSRLAAQRRVQVGIPFAGRDVPGSENLIGFFVNTLVLGCEIGPNTRLPKLLAELRTELDAALRHQDVPLEKLVAELAPERDTSRNPLFQVTFQLFEGDPSPPAFAGLKTRRRELPSLAAKFDLDLALERGSQGGLDITATFATDLFEAATIDRWLELYALLVNVLAARPEQPLATIDLRRPVDRALYSALNAVAAAAPDPRSLASLFVAQAAATPEAIALEHRGQTCSYAELENRSRRLALALRGRGVAPGSMVGLCFERSLDLPLAILAVIRLGAAYVPLDPEYPESRLQGMVEDTAMPIVLGSAEWLGRLPQLGITFLTLAELSAGETGETDSAAMPPLPEVGGGLLPAYTIFTSGSTGRPKGVVVPQQAICRLLLDTNYVKLGPGDVIAQASTASFDAYTFEIWGALLLGGRLLVIDREVLLDPRAFADLLLGRDIAALFLTTAVFTQMVLEEPRSFSRVRQLLFGGERCEPAAVRRALLHPPGHLIHCYGPTECTTFATTFELRELPENATSVPIGRPIRGTEMLVLDPAGQPAAVGVPGELCLGGPCLAHGYWQLPRLTAAAFVPHPATLEPGARVYRTGDLVRLLPSGNIDFLGRIDFQVKVRGFRIELGEVEAVLGSHPAVRERIALTQGQGRDQQLVAFVVVQRDEDGQPAISAAQLEALAAATLPAFAVPRIEVLEAMPLSPTGKIDRKALPFLTARRSAGNEARTAPKTTNQQAVAAAFGEVLGVPDVALEDDFFALGGHSLLATRLIAQVRARCGVDLPVRSLFSAPTVGTLAAEVELLRGHGSHLPPLRHRDASAPPTLSFAQQRLLFLHRFDPQSPVYNLPTAWRLRGRLDLGALEKALLAIETRQEILRTRFSEDAGRPLPEVLPPGPIQLRAEKVAEEALAGRLRDLAEAPFDLLSEKPWRQHLLELKGTDSAEHVLFVGVHHIAFDGLSQRVFERELAYFYAAALRGETSQEAAGLASLAITYADYAAWQQQWLEGELRRQVDFWRGRIHPEPLELPTDRLRPRTPSFRGGHLEHFLDAELVGRIEELGRRHGASAFLSFLSPFQMLLSRLSGQNRVNVGVPFSGRHAGGVDEIIGFFINTLVLSADFTDDPGFPTALQNLRESFAAAFAHQDVPFEKLVEELVTERDASRNPLYQASFQLFEPSGQPIALEGLEVRSEIPELRVAKFDLDLLLERKPEGGIRIQTWYASDLFDATTVARWLELYEGLLRQIAEAPDKNFSSFALLATSDRHLYAEVNHNQTSFPRDASLAAIFAERAAEFPNQIALELRDQKLTYQELDAQTNHLGWRLRELGAGPGTMVGLCFERGLELPIAILAVAKTGAAYVPLDGDYPEARLRGMVEDTAMPILLGSKTQITRLPDLGVPTVTFESLLAHDEGEPTRKPLPQTLGGLAPAVTIFTSGSTGKPKGVVVTQRAVCRLVFETNYIRFEPGDVVVQVSAASFDVYTFEIWGAFLHGGTLLVIDRDTLLDPKTFAEAIAGRDIAALFLTVALFTQMMLEEPQAFTRVRHLMFGGEACEPSIARRALEYPPDHLQNGYGPAECTTYATVFEVQNLAEDAGSVPIGKPVSNTEVLVLDRCGRPASVGVHGELCLGGDGLALGYWRRPALTASSFVPHPCSDVPGARLYRTGDLARLLPSGDFDYLGRIDFQVKVRGYRIELLEVEAVLGRHPAVREKVALTQGKGRDQRLIAFVTVQRDEMGEPILSAAELQRFCGETLPVFSVPLVHILDTMPITTNGKIDRKALPTLKADQLQGDSSKTALVSETEEQVAAAFGEILGAEELGGDADFFALGGHSLLATRLVAALRRRTGVDLPVRQLFTSPSVATLAAAIDELRSQRPAEPALALPVASGASALSFAQQRLYFLHRFSPDSAVYNLPAAYRLRGPLDQGALEKALAAIEERQEILRTHFRDENGEGWPVVLPAGPVLLPLETIGEELLLDRLRELSEQTFDLLNEKPWRARLFRLGPDDHVLFISVHHIAFDGLSLQAFENELAAFYAAACHGKKAALSPLPRTYADFAAWQRAWLQGEELEKQLAFWRGRVHPEPLELPTDRPRPPVPSFHGGSLERTLSPDLIQAVEILGRRHGATPFLAFLAPFQMLLARLSGQYQVNVGVPFSGRHQGDVENLIGFFINTLVLSADLADDPSYETLLVRLREEFARVFAHQDIPFEKLVEELGIARDPSRHPLYQVNFQLFESEVGLAEAGIGPMGPMGPIGRIGLEVEPLDVELRVAKFDMEWILVRTPKGLRISVWYATDLFEASTVAGWLELYEVLLRGVAAAPAEKLSRLPLLRPADLALYARVNNNHTAFPRDSNLIAEWNRHTAEHPDLIACEYHGETLTYRELDQRTSRLARRLLLEGVVPGSMVGVCIARSIDMVVAILAIVKTGSAYTPMDADYPAERLAGMVEDTRMPLLLAGEAQKAKLPEVGTRVLLLAEVEAAAVSLATDPMPADVAFPEAAANVIFTSGSTGRPKGVVVTQRGVLRLVRNTNYMDLKPGDVVVQASSASFDVLTFELWGALMNGGRLLVIDRDTLLQPKLFAAAIEDRDIAALFLTVTLFSQMVLEQPRAFVRVRHLFFGGEACEPSVVRRALENPPGHLQNGYGPTECTCYANVYEVRGLQGEARSVPIGPPMSNTEALILDRFGQIASIGVHGELCLGGDGLAWGYWRRPALTAQTFVAHPSPRTPGERLYRTGDLARLLPTGDFDYLGRIDFQVKVRGFRIELGEIEALLGRHPAVREKIALTRGQGADQLLVAFVVVQTNENGAATVNAAELQRYCTEHLPAFAVPVVRVLDQMPTTPNGKIDRKALPSEDLFGAEENAGEPPRDAFEKLIAETWAEVLALPLPGRDADFFALGGHSLAAMRIISALTLSLGLELPLSLLFGHSNLAAFAAAARAWLEEDEDGRELLAALDELEAMSNEERQSLASS